MQASLKWIVHYVFGEMPHGIWVTHNMVVSLVLPHISKLSGLLVDFVGAE